MIKAQVRFRLSFNQPKQSRSSYGTNNAGSGSNARLGPPPSWKPSLNSAPALHRAGAAFTTIIQGFCKDGVVAPSTTSTVSAHRYCFDLLNFRSGRPGGFVRYRESG